VDEIVIKNYRVGMDKKLFGKSQKNVTLFFDIGGKLKFYESMIPLATKGINIP